MTPTLTINGQLVDVSSAGLHQTLLDFLRHSGRTVPDDVSVVSIGDTDLSQLFSPAITSLTWDLSAVGTAVAAEARALLPPTARARALG